MNKDDVRRAMEILCQQGVSASHRNILQTLGFGSKRDVAKYVHELTYKNELVMTSLVPQKSDSVYAKLMTVTPSMAAEWLETAWPNRNDHKIQLQQYTDAMRHKRWLLTGEPLIFDKYEQLLDGHHRLVACTNAKVTFETMAVFGISHEAMPAIDTGIKRTHGAILTMFLQEPNADLLAATLTWLRHFVNGEVAVFGKKRTSFESQIMLETLECYPDIRKSLYRANQTKRTHLLPPSMAVAMHYLMLQKDAVLADEYFDMLLLGTNLQPDDSVHILRSRLLRDIGNISAKMTPTYKAALVIKTWNKWRRGSRKGGAIRWANTGDRAEPFPVIS